MTKQIAKLFKVVSNALLLDRRNHVTIICVCCHSNSLYMLVRMSEHVINAEDTGSFLSKTFGNCLVQIKRNFDKFIVSIINYFLNWVWDLKVGCVFLCFYLSNTMSFTDCSKCVDSTQPANLCLV